MAQRSVFVAGGTGYMGQRLIGRLLADGVPVRALARRGSESKVPTGAETVIGDALDRDSYWRLVPSGATFVHLVGVPHPSPAKAEQFNQIDLVSLRESAAAARDAGVDHFVYVSVAHPAPVMAAYIEVRMKCEEIIRAAAFPTVTILRPWYVLGPGHWWPLTLKPMYWLAEMIPALRPGALRLGLVTLQQMVDALVWAVLNPQTGLHVLEVPAIRGPHTARPELAQI